MNILSYNVRGLGRGVKWAAIRRLVNKQKADMICIQETKRDQIHLDMCQTLWGYPDVGWDFLPATNTAGGLLCIWKEQAFKLVKKEKIGNSVKES